MRMITANSNAPDHGTDDEFSKYQAQPWYGMLNYGYGFLWTFGQEAIDLFLQTHLPGLVYVKASLPKERKLWGPIASNSINVRVRPTASGFTVSIPLATRNAKGQFPYFRYLANEKYMVWNKMTAAQKKKLIALVNTAKAASITADIDVSKIEDAVSAYFPLDAHESEILDDLKKSSRIRMVLGAISEEILKKDTEFTANQETDPAFAEMALVYQLLAKKRPMFFVEYDVPMDVAKYISNSDKPTVSDLGAFFSNNVSSVGSFGSNPWTDISQSFSNSVKNRVFDLGSIKSPLGKTNIGFLPKAGYPTPVWVPPMASSETIDKMMEAAYLDETGEWSPINMHEPEANPFDSYVSSTAVIGADWTINRLLSVDSKGTFDAILNLEGIQKADANYVYKFMRKPIMSSYIETLYLTASSWPGFTVPKIRPPSKDYEEYGNMHGTMIQAEAFHKSGTKEHTVLKELRGKIAAKEELIFADIYPESPNNTFADVFTFYAEVTKFIRSRTPEQLMKLKLNTSDLEYIANAMLVVDNHKRIPEATEAYVGYKQKNRRLSKVDKIDPSTVDLSGIPFLSPDVKLLPHQVKAWAALKEEPKNAVLSVDAGGGKTPINLLDIAYHLGKGLRRPLVLAPERLVKNYLNTSWLFGGRINFVPITTDAFYSSEWGMERLAALINNAPPNTIFFIDYNFLTPRNASVKMTDVVNVGTRSYNVHIPTAFLRQFDWGGIWIDESQVIKNLDSGISGQVAAFVNSVPLRREASGTYVHDGIHDVVGQFSIMEPSTFGTMIDFRSEFYTDAGRSGVPNPGASVAVRERMEDEAAVVTLRRKEWAALLPKRQDHFWPVQLTPAQSSVYDLIIKQQEEELQRRMAEDPAFADLLSSIDNEVPEAEEAKAKAEALDNMLHFYLQRMEQFLTAPGSDPLGASLKGADAVTPKMERIIALCREHIKKGYVGKIIIWTQYVESAKAVFDNLPNDLKGKAVHYTAAKSNEALMAANRNDKMILVGNEQSMNTGEDLQMFSRIIRLETVWNWGTLEQGESRVNRPLMNDPRLAENGGHGIFYDWVFCDMSADVTKIARMVSKMVTTLKFYNRDSQAYQAIPTPPMTKLNRHTLFRRQKYDSEDGCMEHFHTYTELARLEEKTFEEFKADPKNNHKPFPVKDGGVIKGSAIIDKVPYVPRMTLWGQKELGLQPLYDYLQETSNVKAGLTREVDPNWTGKGVRVHTEYGDGEIHLFFKSRAGGKTSVKVRLDDSGEVVTCPILTTFVLPDSGIKGRVRDALVKRIGMKVVSIKDAQPVANPDVEDVEPVPVPTKKTKVGKSVDQHTPNVVEEEQEVERKGRGPAATDTPGLEMFVETYNGFLSLCIDSADADVEKNKATLKRLGFIKVPDYIYSKVTNWKQLDKWYDAIDAKGFVIPQEYADQLEDDIARWRTGRSLTSFANGLAASSVRKFMQQEKIPLPKGQITPYLVAHNHEVYLCLNKRVNQKNLAKVRSTTSAGIRWQAMEGEVWKFCKTKADLQSTIEELDAKGLLSNAAQVKAEARKARIRMPNQKID